MSKHPAVGSKVNADWVFGHLNCHYVFSLTTSDPLLNTRSSGNSRWATDSMSAYAHVVTITVTIAKDFVRSVCFHLLENVLLLIMMNMLCVAWRVFNRASLTTWYCAMCYNSMWVSMLLLFSSHCDEGDVHIQATETLAQRIPQCQGGVALFVSCS